MWLLSKFDEKNFFYNPVQTKTQCDEALFKNWHPIKLYWMLQLDRHVPKRVVYGDRDNQISNKI